ncbi:MAG TPA: hypothetical protein VLB90_04740 [Pseudomonadales bacterium]|nr:hypothetical protein [Pseudomonadales bacterium]
MWLYGLLCGSTGHDDSHITFWQAQALLDYGDLRNYNGARIEQSSSLLMTLLTSLTALVTRLSIVDSGYLLNLGAAILTLWLVWRLAQQSHIARPWLAAALTALTPYFSYWAWSGMETTLAASCVMLFIFTLLAWQKKPSSIQFIALMFSALALAAVRPEMVLLGPVFLFIVAILLRRPAVLLFILPFLLLSFWRHNYFGQWFPNPVYAKSGSIDLQQLQNGLDYFQRLFRHPLAALGVSITLLAFCVSCVACLRTRLQHHLLLLCCLWVGIYGGFVIASGGDWMKEGRFWVPLIAPMWLAICLTFLSDKRTLLTRYVLPLILVCYTPVFINTYNLGTPVWNYSQQKTIAGDQASFFETTNREHVRDWPALRSLQTLLAALNPSVEKPLTVMSKQMGMVNYHLASQFHGKFLVRDMAGLVDNTLRNCAVIAQDGFDKQGLRINYRKFFERLPQAEKECGLRAPDIIYDIYGWGETTPLPDFLRSQGYRIVFRQTGRVDVKPGIDITAQEMIAVRTELLQGLDIQDQDIDFNQLTHQ